MAKHYSSYVKSAIWHGETDQAGRYARDKRSYNNFPLNHNWLLVIGLQETADFRNGQFRENLKIGDW